MLPGIVPKESRSHLAPLKTAHRQIEPVRLTLVAVVTVTIALLGHGSVDLSRDREPRQRTIYCPGLSTVARQKEEGIFLWSTEAPLHTLIALSPSSVGLTDTLSCLSITDGSNLGASQVTVTGLTRAAGQPVKVFSSSVTLKSFGFFFCMHTAQEVDRRAGSLSPGGYTGRAHIHHHQYSGEI